MTDKINRHALLGGLSKGDMPPVDPGSHTVVSRDLRHTCTAELVSIGAPRAEVRDLLGRGTVKMTEQYARLAPENLRRAVAVLEDRSHSGHTGEEERKTG